MPTTKQTGSSHRPALSVVARPSAFLLPIATLIYCFSYVCEETLPPLFGPSLAPLHVISGISSNELATVPSLRSFGSVVGGLVGGLLFDTAPVKASLPNAHLALIIALMTTAAANYYIPYASTMISMAATALVLGVFNGFFRAGANCLVLRVHGEKAAPYMQALHLFGGMGRLLAPLTLRTFLEDEGVGSEVEAGGSQARIRTGLEKAYFVVSCLPIGASICLFLLSMGMVLTKNQGGGAAAPKVEEKQAKAKKNKTSTNSKEQNRQKNSTNETKASSSSSSSSSVAFILLASLAALLMGAQASFQNYIPSYALSVGFSSKDSVLLSAAFGSSFTLGRLLSVPVSLSASPRTMVLADVCGATAAVLLIVAFPASPGALWIATGLFGLSMASAFPSILNFAKQELQGISGTGITMVMQSASLGTVLAPLLVVWGGGSGDDQNGFVKVIVAMIVAADGTFWALYMGL